MSTFDVVSTMNPAARAVAEVRAREAGMSLGEWLEALVYEQAAPTPLRRHVSAAGGLAFRWAGASGSNTGEIPLLPSAQSGVDIMTYAAEFHFPEIESTNLQRVLALHRHHEDTRSAWQLISAFPPKINQAAILLSAAFAEADVTFRLPPHRPSARYKKTSLWYHTIVDTSLDRSREVRNALVHHWAPRGRAEHLWSDAFFTLCDLTSARQELLVLFHHDRGRASIELAKHLELATQQFELSANLLSEIETPAREVTSEEQRFTQLRASLLEKAGGGLSLTEGAERLGVTRQALHKRIKAGTALGMMDGEELVLPRLQFVGTGEKVKLIKGLGSVITLFERSGGWSALQFLVEKDPNLAAIPIQVLEAGDTELVVAAARAYLGLDEG